MFILFCPSAQAASKINLDGTHDLAKKGGESVAYQRRKKAKTTIILPMTDGNGFIIASTGLIAVHHNDTFNLKAHLQKAFKSMKRLDLAIEGVISTQTRRLTPNQPIKPAAIMT